ncbi:hypothetical protein [Paraburkholderia hiiakae]|uniref:hypothetical protein n=1 Tax=Paraburkholderia hiiakae TaxID=1081782 RepID=UPI00191912C4|nr:hypothetical protein [Paraburkholderia hiiakae]
MKVRSAVAALLISASTIVAAQQPGKAAVYVDDRTEDVQGHRLAYAVKEQIRNSASMRLVDTKDESALQIHLSSLDPDNDQIRTVYSMALSLINFSSPSSPPVYLDSTSGVCGAHVIDQCANSILARVDSEISAVRAALAKSRK